MNGKILSIVIPVFNSERTLNRLIDSLINKKYQDDYEVIFVNDGSHDDSSYIIKTSCEKNSNFRLINKDNTGVSDTRNIGMASSRGEYITFIDSDDFYEREFFDTIIPLLKNNYYESLCFGFNRVYSNKDKLKVPLKGSNSGRIGLKYGIKKFLSFELQTLYQPYAWNKIFRMDILRNNDIEFNTRKKIGEDGLFVLEYFNCIQEVTVIKEILYNYYYEPTSAMQSYRKDLYYENTSYIPELRKLASKYNYPVTNDELLLFFLTRFFSFIMNEVKGKNYLEGKKMVLLFSNYELVKQFNILHSFKINNLKYKIYFILLKTKLCLLVYDITYLRKGLK